MHGLHRRTVGLAKYVALDLAKNAGKIGHGLLRELLSTKHKHGMGDKGGTYLPGCRVGQRAAQVDRRQFGTEATRQRVNRQLARGTRWLRGLRVLRVLDT